MPEPYAPTTKSIPGTISGRWTTSDHVHQVLQGLIISNNFRPGDRLVELELAAQLAVSRTPLRHALQRLVAEGWLRRNANGTIHVVDVSEEEIEALYAVRLALEELMMSQAVAHLDKKAIDLLTEILVTQDRAAKANNAEGVAAQGELFHKALWTLSGNLVGINFLETVAQRTTRYRRLSFAHPYRFMEGSAQHWKILQALDQGKISKAKDLLRTHVHASREYALQAFRNWREETSVSRDSVSVSPATLESTPNAPSLRRKRKPSLVPR